MITALVSLTFTTNSLYASETPTDLEINKSIEKKENLPFAINNTVKERDNSKRDMIVQVYGEGIDESGKIVDTRKKHKEIKTINNNRAFKNIYKNNHKKYLSDKKYEIEYEINDPNKVKKVTKFKKLEKNEDNKNIEWVPTSSDRLIKDDTYREGEIKSVYEGEDKKSQKVINKFQKIEDKRISQSYSTEIKSKFNEIAIKQDTRGKIVELKNLQSEINNNPEISNSDKKKLLRKTKQEIKFTKKNLIDKKVRDMNCKNKKTGKEKRRCKKQARAEIKSL